ncbi:MAG: class I SAM-dependent methyltransferase [Candidatus Methanoperedens sp.]|nr:class I SAM-dependent methyltransferase [Candidatus Methanoperedens sp.]
MKKLTLSRPMTPSEIEDLYYKIVRTPEFYNEDYANEWKKDDTPQNIISKMAVKYFKPARVIDIGCGLGNVVKYLRKEGVDAYGIDYSETFINTALPDLRKFLRVGDVTQLDLKEKSFDLVICMEVLEHLPLKLVDKAIDELKKICKGSIFITMPCFGPNEYGPYALPLYEKGWFEDAKKNIPFSQIVVDEKGVPDCGHLTLATYRWWSEKFLQHNLVRDGNLEIKINDDRELDLRRWNWNIYVLNKISSNNISAENSQFGSGWYHVEDWGNNGQIRWTEKEAEAFLMPQGHETTCKIDFYSGPRELIYDTKGEIIIEQDDSTSTFEKGKIKFSLPVHEWGIIEVPLSKLIPGRHLRVKIKCDRKFNPRRILNSTDNRELGIAVRRIYLE